MYCNYDSHLIPDKMLKIINNLGAQHWLTSS